jgi:hypothetical protein
VSGKDTVPLVADILRRHGLIESTRPALLALSHSNAPSSERWVDRVIASTS